MQPAPPAIRLLVPANIRHNSGGNVYNAALAAALEQLGSNVTIQPVAGDWPVASKEERRRLAGRARSVPGNAARTPSRPCRRVILAAAEPLVQITPAAARSERASRSGCSSRGMCIRTHGA